jgi:prefoldin subunit 5
MPGMSIEELNARVKELEEELKKACQTARDRARELATIRHAATATTESLRKQVELPSKCANLSSRETTARAKAAHTTKEYTEVVRSIE